MNRFTCTVLLSYPFTNPAHQSVLCTTHRWQKSSKISFAVIAPCIDLNPYRSSVTHRFESTFYLFLVGQHSQSCSLRLQCVLGERHGEVGCAGAFRITAFLLTPLIQRRGRGWLCPDLQAETVSVMNAVLQRCRHMITAGHLLY